MDGLGTIRDAGAYLLEGLWEGILSKLGWLKDKITGVIDSIKEWFTGEDGFDEHSPSKWAEKVFRRVLEGGEIGFERGLPGILSGASDAVRDIQNALSADPFNVSGGYQLSGGYTAYHAPQLAAAGAGYGGTAAPLENVIVERPIQVVLNERVLGETMLRYQRTQQRAGR